MRNTPLAITLALALALAGCIESLRSASQAQEAAQDADEALKGAADAAANASSMLGNATSKNATSKPPVARMKVFAESGALVYQSTFIADDPKEPISVAPNSNLTLLASDSEAVATGATLTKFTWSAAGKPLDGRQAKLAVGDPGIYPVMLTVTDSAGQTDMHHVTLAVVPTPFDVEQEVATDLVVGVGGVGLGATFTVDIVDVVEEKPHQILAIAFATGGGATCDTILTVEQPDGTKLGPQDSGGDETITLGPSVAGAYKVTVEGFLCAAPTGVPVTITITYVEIVAGLDGHGGHAGH